MLEILSEVIVYWLTSCIWFMQAFAVKHGLPASQPNPSVGLAGLANLKSTQNQSIWPGCETR